MAVQAEVLELQDLVQNVKSFEHLITWTTLSLENDKDSFSNGNSALTFIIPKLVHLTCE